MGAGALAPPVLPALPAAPAELLHEQPPLVSQQKCFTETHRPIFKSANRLSKREALRVAGTCLFV